MTKSPVSSTKQGPAKQGSALEGAVSRALRDNLVPLQRTVEDLQEAYADLVAACASTRPSNTLPALVRTQSASAALSAALSVLSNFVTLALQPGRGAAIADLPEVEELPLAEPAESEIGEVPQPANVTLSPAAVQPAAKEEQSQQTALVSDSFVEPSREESDTIVEPSVEAATAPVDSQPVPADSPAPASADVAQTSVVESQSFQITNLPAELQELHRRANRVAKVAMQDIKLLRPKDVRLGVENKDICDRMRVDLDKARKEYDRRFRPILDHPVDYFHEWMVAILADGNAEALGKYPYPSSLVHH